MRMERAPLPIAIWVLALATLLLQVPAPHAPTPAGHRQAAPPPTADVLYRAGHFEQAATIAVAPDNELYAQLARAWATGMDPTTRPSDALIALREAAKLDIALGGVFADELLAKERQIAPLAVHELIANGDREGAEAAQHVVDTLGH